MADPVITTLRILGTRAYINGARASSRAIRDVGKAGDETGRGMQLFKGSIAGVTGALGIMTSAAKSSSMVLGALGLYGAKVGLEFDANIERAQVGMKTLLGSSKEAKKVVKDVQDFAVKAPMLNVAQSIQSTQQLIGAGLKAKDAVPTMTAFSDTLSAMGRKPEDLQRMTYAFQQMMSKGKVTAEELRGQLGEIFPASKLMARGMGISMAELAARMKQGEVVGMKPIRLLLGEMEKEFGGATKRSAQTFSGMLNNMKEQGKVILGDIFKPLFVMLRDDIFPWVQKIGDSIAKWAHGGGMKRVINSFKEGFTGKLGRRTDVGGAAGSPGKGAARIGAEVKAPPKREGFYGLIQKAGDLLGQKVLPEVTKQAKLLWDALKPAEPFLRNVLLPFVEGFAVGLYKGLVGLIPLVKLFAQFLGWIGQKAAPLKPVFMGIGFVIGYVFGPGKLGIFRLFGKVLGVIGSQAARIFNWFDRVSPAVRSITSAVLTLLAKVPGWASKIVSGLTSPFRSLGKKIAGFISAAVGAAVSAITSFGAAVGSALGEAIWNALPGWLKKLLQGGVEGLSKAGGFLSAKAPTKNGRVGGTTPAPGRVNRGAKTRGPAGIIPRRAG